MSDEAFEGRVGFTARLSCESPSPNVRAALDPTNPDHYRSHPSGVECITVTEHMGFCIGNAVKYLWRAGLKGGADMRLADMRKARWYVDREIARLEREEKCSRYRGEK